MKNSIVLAVIMLTCSLNVSVYAQDPNASTWGLYASGVGETLKPGMDPCWITYTVALTTNVRIQENVDNGLMGVIATGINWFEATQLQRQFGRYFDDEPDGIFKLSPCEVILPDVNGTWSSGGRGNLVLTQSGSRISGTAAAVNAGDHWGAGHRNGGSITGVVNNDGSIVLRTSWGDGTFTEDFMRLDADQTTLSGVWNWYTDSSKTSKKGTGHYAVLRK